MNDNYSTYECPRCGKIFKRDDTRPFILSFCEKTGRNTMMAKINTFTKDDLFKLMEQIDLELHEILEEEKK